jgi:hypothetical protein
MKVRKYYLDNSVESLLRLEKRKHNSKKVKVVDLIYTGAICSLAVVMTFYLCRIFLHLPEILILF